MFVAMSCTRDPCAPVTTPGPGLTSLTNAWGLPSVPFMRSVNLYDAKIHLSTLVDQAARGEKIIIAEDGEPRAMLVPLEPAKRRRKPARALKVTYVAPDFDAPDPEIAALFEGAE